MKTKSRGRAQKSGRRPSSECLGTLLLCLLTLAASAQQYAVPWFKIAGGGATAPSTGGVYTLSGTIGQVDAGRVASTNGAYRVESGYWAIAIQQLGYPQLSVTQVDTNAVLSWITAEPGMILQVTTNLTTPATTWNDLGTATATNGTTNLLAVPLSDAERAFFRLRRP